MKKLFAVIMSLMLIISSAAVLPADAAGEKASVRQQLIAYFQSKTTSDLSQKQFKFELLEKIRGKVWIYRVEAEVSDCMIRRYYLGSYLYKSVGGGYDVRVFDGKTTYELQKAYEKKLIRKSDLKTLHKYINKLSGVSFGYHVIKLKAGDTYDLFIDHDAKSTNKKAGRIVNYRQNKYDMQVGALSKGRFSIVINGEVADRFIVTSNPKLTLGGKSVRSVTLKQGKSLKLKIKGKVKYVDNKYKSTATAKVIGKKSAETIKIKGLQQGSTKLTVTVNGKKLTLRVNVK